MNKYNYISPFIQYFTLIWTMVKRDTSTRYKGSILGVLWSFINPLFMLAIYTFVFQYVFKAKWGEEREVTVGFSMVLFSGLIVHLWLSEVLNRSVSLIRNNVNLVKKVLFPLEVLSWNILLSSFFQFLAGLFILMIFVLVSGQQLGDNFYLIVLALIPFVIFLLGASYFLSAISVFVKDLEQIIQMVITVLLFTSTIFFPLNAVPSLIRPLVLINPLTVPVEMFRNAFFSLEPVNEVTYYVYFLFCLIFSLFSYRLFMKLKSSFADVV